MFTQAEQHSWHLVQCSLWLYRVNNRDVPDTAGGRFGFFHVRVAIISILILEIMMSQVSDIAISRQELLFLFTMSFLRLMEDHHVVLQLQQEEVEVVFLSPMHRWSSRPCGSCA